MNGIETYKKHPYDHASENLEVFIKEHMDLVKRIALTVKKKLPSTIETNDLIQSGYVGLLEAKKTYQPDLGTPFEAFACSRIRGAIIDSIRKNSWLSKDSLKFIQALNAAIHKLQQQNGREPTTDEIIQELNIDHEEYIRNYQMLNLSNMLSLKNENDSIAMSEEENPSIISDKQEMFAILKNEIINLNLREQQILSLYYNDDMSFKEIAQIFDISEARVCQIHNELLAKLRKKIKLKKNIPTFSA